MPGDGQAPTGQSVKVVRQRSSIRIDGWPPVPLVDQPLLCGNPFATCFQFSKAFPKTVLFFRVSIFLPSMLSV